MSDRCIGTPVSWFCLERYCLGEIAAPERAQIAEHLDACTACRACVAQIEADEGQALPPLALRPTTGDGETRVRNRPFGRLGPIAGGRWLAVAAAAVAVAVGIRGARRTENGGEVARVDRAATKGGDVTLSLVRDDGEVIAGEQGMYRDGDRFKALITCPPSMHAVFDLVVLDGDGPSFPIEPAADITCGNGVPLPGAFRLTGRAEKTVCIGWSDGGAVDRNNLVKASDGRLCVRVVRAPPGDR
jgi:hypothetical protein